MDRRNLSDLGDEIKDIVQNAVNTRDFGQLNRDIGNTVNSALDEVKGSLGLNRGSWGNRFGQNDGNQNWNQNQYENQNQYGNNSTYRNHNWNQDLNQRRYSRSQYRENYRRRDRNYDNQKNEVRKNNNVKIQPLDKVPVGRISGVVYSVFGGMGIGIFGIAILVMIILSQTLQGAVFTPIALGLSPLLFGSFILTFLGGQVRKRYYRYRNYVSILNGRNYCTIKEIISATGRNTDNIVKDLRQMIIAGMFPEGHIDEQKTCFMLNNESYQQYLKLQENLRTQQMETQKVQKEEKAGQVNSELQSAIMEGRSYITQIREANDAIPGEEISQKMSRLENVAGKIFDYIEQHPEQFSEIHKFMDYYLPTTLKLLNAYKEFDNQPVQGENITTAKKEIEGTLDTIILAFENLLDSLFEDAAMDISTDISVLQTMLAQEGLTKKDFEK
jgi:5-bromo-4-chloroindolyl phosphate hydrolysis protein